MSARRKKAPVAPVYTASNVLQAAQAAHEAAVSALRTVQCIDAAEMLAAAGLDLEANDRASDLIARVLHAVVQEFRRVASFEYHDDWLARLHAADALPHSWAADDLRAALREEHSLMPIRLRSVVGPLESAASAVREARKALDAARATGDAEDVQRCYVEGLIAAHEAAHAAAGAAPWVVLRKTLIAEYDEHRKARERGERMDDWRLERQGHVETFAEREETIARFEALTGQRLNREYLHTRLPLIAPEVSP